MQQNLFTEAEITTVSPAIAKPFVSRSTFYHGDCLIEMDKIADKSVDMILCDLPYGVTQNKWDAIIPFDKIWQKYERVIKYNGAIVLTAQDKFTAKLILSSEKLHRYNLIWQKSRPTGFLNANRLPLRNHEDICIFYKKLPTYNPQFSEGNPNHIKDGLQPTYNNNNYGNFKATIQTVSNKKHPKSIIDIPSLDSCELLHPTQKPVALMEYLIKTYTNEGETVLDNCMGSGTTGVACKKTGRHFIGIEKDEKYFEIAVSRVSAYCG